MRGQAAVEYLMTYGWAILILVTVLGILYSVGILNPQSYTQEECLFQPSLKCESLSLNTNGEVGITLRNGMGFPIRITGVEISYEGKACSGNNPARIVGNNDQIKISGKCNGDFISGNVYNFKVKIDYAVDDERLSTTGLASIRASG